MARAALIEPTVIVLAVRVVEAFGVAVAARTQLDFSPTWLFISPRTVHFVPVRIRRRGQ